MVTPSLILTHIFSMSLIMLPCPELYCCILPLYALPPPPSLSPSSLSTHIPSTSPAPAAGLLLMLHHPPSARCSPQLVKDLQGSRGKAYPLVSYGADCCCCCCCCLLTAANWKPNDWWVKREWVHVSACVCACVDFCENSPAGVAHCELICIHTQSSEVEMYFQKLEQHIYTVYVCKVCKIVTCACVCALRQS